MRLLMAAVVVASLGACGSPARDTGDGGAGTADACSGLECRVEDCAARNMPPTTITGTVYAPNGTLALYGATVYVPNGDPGPLTDGVACTRCQNSLPGGSVANTVSGSAGEFTLTDVPSGRNIPLVIQIGKWRRQVDIVDVVPCTANAVPATLTSLPKNRTQGDLPRIAIATGSCDALECLVKKIGVDASEFTPDSGPGRVHLFASNGATTIAGGGTLGTAASLWGDLDKLKQYDVALFSCECGARPAEKTQAMMDNVKAFADLGGRVFLSHYHNIWIDGEVGVPAHAPAVWPEIADCSADEFVSGNGIIDTVNNPKGSAFSAWMQVVAATATTGQFPILEGRQTCNSIDTFKAERWVYAQSGSTQYPQIFQFSTPNEAPVADRCGKVVMSDMHVASGSTSSSGTAFPGGCSSAAMTAQEKALAFMIFDISSCVGPIF